MPNTTKLIQLTAEELIALIKERTVQRDGIVISSTASFLSIIGLLEDQMTKELSHDKRKLP